MDEAEWEVYRKDREARIESLTQQLRDAVATTEKLMHDVVAAIPALRKANDDPAAQKLVERWGHLRP